MMRKTFYLFLGITATVTSAYATQETPRQFVDRVSAELGQNPDLTAYINVLNAFSQYFNDHPEMISDDHTESLPEEATSPGLLQQYLYKVSEEFIALFAVTQGNDWPSQNVIEAKQQVVESLKKLQESIDDCLPTAIQNFLQQNWPEQPKPIVGDSTTAKIETPKPDRVADFVDAQLPAVNNSEQVPANDNAIEEEESVSSGSSHQDAVPALNPPINAIVLASIISTIKNHEPDLVADFVDAQLPAVNNPQHPNEFEIIEEEEEVDYE